MSCVKRVCSGILHVSGGRFQARARGLDIFTSSSYADLAHVCDLLSCKMAGSMSRLRELHPYSLSLATRTCYWISGVCN